MSEHLATGKVSIPVTRVPLESKIYHLSYLRSNLLCGSSDFSHSIEYKERGLVVRETETINLSFLITSCVQQRAYISNMYSYHFAEFNLLHVACIRAGIYAHTHVRTSKKKSF